MLGVGCLGQSEAVKQRYFVSAHVAIGIHLVWHRSVYQELARLGSPEQQALLHKQLDDLGAPISFCKYKLKLSNDDDAGGLSVPDSPSAKVIQVEQSTLSCYSAAASW